MLGKAYSHHKYGLIVRQFIEHIEPNRDNGVVLMLLKQFTEYAKNPDAEVPLLFMEYCELFGIDVEADLVRISDGSYVSQG